MLWVPVTLLALLASAQGRAVNISNTWVLPEEGFPVFYRYFRDRISWYEADAVCQFHHANLVTVDTTAQYDAVRAYLKELDISSAVWVGLIRSNPDGDFTWTSKRRQPFYSDIVHWQKLSSKTFKFREQEDTYSLNLCITNSRDYRGLSNEGYWSSAPDARAAPLCAAADPVADYRWEARACGGPTVASFICELPVPQWALGNEGCMVRALPALTVLYLPESAAIQLTADCGLAGVKRVQCTGNVKREELLKELSCNDEEEISSTLSLASFSAMWSVTETPETESTSDEQSAEDTVVIEYKETSSIQSHITETPTPYTSNDMTDGIKSNQNNNDDIKKPLKEDLYLKQTYNGNIVSNDIPHQDNVISVEKLEENKNLKHRLLYDEMTRRGNFETIFTQPTDHFVPPLVMAKARISDDMIVLSLKEKYAQQISEQQLLKHNLREEHMNLTSPQMADQDSTEYMVTPISKTVQHDQTLKIPVHTAEKVNSVKKDMKSSVPKKYIDKYNNVKGKIWKTVDYKLQKSDKKDDFTTAEPLNTTKNIETTTANIEADFQNNSEEDPIIDLTVIIKESGIENSEKIFYSNHSDSLTKIDLSKNVTNVHDKNTDERHSTAEKPIFTTSEKPLFTKNSTVDVHSTPKVILNHEVIKITLINDSKNNEKSTPIVFEVSTLAPVLNNDSAELKEIYFTSTSTGHLLTQNLSEYSESSSFFTEISTTGTQAELDPTTVTVNNKNSASVQPNKINNTVKIEEDVTSTKILSTAPQIITDAISMAMTTMSIDKHISEKTQAINVTTASNIPLNLTEVTVTEKADALNGTHTKYNEEEHEEHESDMIDDYQSPLLSAANEPLHRPSRSRRPQPPPNRINKFNPFRILG